MVDRTENGDRSIQSKGEGGREGKGGDCYAALCVYLGLGKGCDSLRELEKGWFLGFEICTLESWF